MLINIFMSNYNRLLQLSMLEFFLVESFPAARFPFEVCYSYHFFHYAYNNNSFLPDNDIIFVFLFYFNIYHYIAISLSIQLK